MAAICLETPDSRYGRNRMSGPRSLIRYHHVDPNLGGLMEATPGLVGKGMEQAVTANEELALQARTNSGAFGELYRQHREAVFRYLRARCRDEDLAVELTAVTFEKAFVGIGRYQTRGGGFVAWLLRIARNAATDHERHHRPLVPQWPMDSDRASDDPSPEDLAVQADERRRLRLLVADLPDLQRDALAMRFGSGLSAREIGEVIGKSEDATQKLISRAVARLKEVVDDRF